MSINPQKRTMVNKPMGFKTMTNDYACVCIEYGGVKFSVSVRLYLVPSECIINQDLH